jgi:hypothetical protein
MIMQLHGVLIVSDLSFVKGRACFELGLLRAEGSLGLSLCWFN